MLHERIAKTLGWSVKETQSMSLLMLRELVRDKDADLAREITRGIKTGEYILEPAPEPEMWSAVEVHRATSTKNARYVVVGSFRARSREEAEAAITRRWPYRELEARPASEVKTLESVEVYDPHRGGAAARLVPTKKAKSTATFGMPKPPKKKSETYKAAQARLLSELRGLGWETRPDLKFPWAKHPHHTFRVNFKAQAVYLNDHSLFLDIRGMSLEEFVKDIARVANIRGGKF